MGDSVKEREAEAAARGKIIKESRLRAGYILKNGSIFKVGNIHYLQVKGYLFQV